jgi:hypothetical protein
VTPEATVALLNCVGGAGSERCRALGPAFGAGVFALYRPTPYFAFGGLFSYSWSTGTLPAAGAQATGPAETAEVSTENWGLSLAGRVYLLEAGYLDPYLELCFGYASFRTTFSAAGSRSEDAAFGPSARAGGGVDAVLAEGLRLGVAGGYSELVFGRGERCRAGGCSVTSPAGGAVRGGWLGSVRVTLLFGDPL